MTTKEKKKNWDGVSGSIKICKVVIKTFFSELKNAKLHTILIFVLIILSSIANTINLKYSLLFDSTTEHFYRNIAIFAIAEMCEVFFSAIYDYFLDKLFVSLQVKMAIKAFKNILVDEGSSFDLSNGRVQYCIREGSLAIAELMRTLLFSMINEVIQLIPVFALSCVSIGLIYTLFIFLCFFFLIIFHIKITQRKIFYKRRYNKAIADSENLIYESLLNYDTVKACCTEDVEVERMQTKCMEIKNAYINHSVVENILFFSEEFLFSLTKCLMMVHFVYTNRKDSQVGFGVRTIISMGKMVMNGITMSGRNYKKIVDGLINTRLVLDYLYGESISDGDAISYRKFKHNIEFGGVDVFVGNKKILKGLNFSIFKGQKVALCSKNSAGKTTLLKTILNMGKYTGVISIDGIPIDRIKLNDYRSLFYYMPQENNLFNESIAYNICYGSQGVTKESVEIICKRLGIHDLINSMEMGYDTLVGERGKMLSGGFRQKILIARALIRNSPICILDEPFNNLDKATQNSVLDIIFGDCFKSITVFVTIHDPVLRHRFERVIDVEANIAKNI